MTTEQVALIIREAIFAAAKHHGCKPSETYDPRTKKASLARNMAISLSHSQGISKSVLCVAFRRGRDTISRAILQER